MILKKGIAKVRGNERLSRPLLSSEDHESEENVPAGY